MFDFLWVMVDHPRSVVADCCCVLKFWLDRIYSFGDSAILDCRVLARICLFTPTFRFFSGIFPRNDVTDRPTPKCTSLHGKTSFEPENVKIGSAVGPARVIENKGQQSHKGVIFHLVGEKPTPNRFAPKFA